MSNRIERNRVQYRLFKLFSTAAVVAMLAAASARAVDITGAGATFPYPVYAKWADAYKKQTDVALNYQSIGSGGGIKQIQAKTVDFGASDMPMKAEELEKNGLVQFPAIVGGNVIVYNLKGVESGKVRLTGALIADIFLGKVTKWNDPAIAKLNAGVNLPGDAITVVHRSDGSGTTFIFANYLSKASAEWKTKVGEGTSVKWPAGVGCKGNEGVASYVQKVNGAIGYVEYAFAKQNKLAVAAIQNQAGEFVLPDDLAFKAAAANAQWEKSPGFYEILTNQPGKGSWPMTGASFILMHKAQEKPANAKQVLAFFDWAFRSGGKMAEELDYVPLPESVVKLVQNEWKAKLKDTAGKTVYP
jgi:phosphate transport system substrate-binding protein